MVGKQKIQWKLFEDVWKTENLIKIFHEMFGKQKILRKIFDENDQKTAQPGAARRKSDEN